MDIRKAAGQAAVWAAELYWAEGVRDHPQGPGFEEISEIVSTSVGKRMQYRHQKRMWCGDFVAACYADRDDLALAPCFRQHLLQSTYRLWVLAHYTLDWSKKHKRGVWPSNLVRAPGWSQPEDIRGWHEREQALRLVQSPRLRGGRLTWLPEPGDIATVGVSKSVSGRTRPWGRHIVLVRGVGEDGLHTVEGNGWGTPPPHVKERRWEGVVQNVRPMSDVQMILRLSRLDFTPGLEVIR